ncbi:MAG: ubiquinol oxidase subunit II [Lautropia sp.]|nr:ubiquinol oxidase subunit II [Lautropia sp.]
MKSVIRPRLLPWLATAFLLAGCDTVLLNPSGYIALQQRDLIYISTGLMLLVIVPVIILTLLFAWRYRAGNVTARYEPDWHHSNKIEAVVWTIPIIIIIILGTITWITTHKLDPFRPLEEIEAGRPVPAGVEPLEIQVVAMDWKWLFIYPEQGIALVNEAAAPVDRPVRFKITSTSVMNSFFIPAMAGMIYAMPGMESHLNAIINKAGTYDGLSANYSGAGFSHMRFKFHGLSDRDFDAWVEKVKSADRSLSRQRYLELARPSEKVPPTYFASVDPRLFDRIRHRCVEPDRMCMDMIMAIDKQGGLGILGVDGVASEALNQPKHRGELPLYRTYVSEALCAPMVSTFTPAPVETAPASGRSPAAVREQAPQQAEPGPATEAAPAAL